MKIRVRHFAGLRDEIGQSEQIIDLPPEITNVGRLTEFMAALHVQIYVRRACLRWARNDAFATVDEEIADGDTVALIPPVAGG